MEVCDIIPLPSIKKKKIALYLKKTNQDKTKMI